MLKKYQYLMKFSLDMYCIHKHNIIELFDVNLIQNIRI